MDKDKTPQTLSATNQAGFDTLLGMSLEHK